MIEIRRIKPDEAATAKRVIYRVAHEIFKDPLPLEDSIRYHEARGELKDMDDIQQSYFNNGGIFLVIVDEAEIIGTGALRKLEDDICELKRLWLLIAYQGKGLGYRMIQELFAFARIEEYRKIRLQTDAVSQSRALEFCRRIGFYEIPRYTERTDDIAMEMAL